MALIETHLAGLKKTKPHEYGIRFVFGGLACVLAGLVAKKFGPTIGGLFLAFPAIFPAGATLIESHAKAEKKNGGEAARKHGRECAGAEAAGTAVGCFGLAAFAAVAWRGMPGHSAWTVIALAAGVWAGVGVLLWLVTRQRG